MVHYFARDVSRYWWLDLVASVPPPQTRSAHPYVQRVATRSWPHLQWIYPQVTAVVQSRI